MSQSVENKVIIDGQSYYGGLNQPNLKFIKVNVDCWERIFDFLLLRDILAMSQTCQRMRQIGGHYFRKNFHGTACSLNRSTCMEIYVGGTSIERVDFLRFIDTLTVHNKLEDVRKFSSMGLLTSLTTLRLFKFNLNKRQLHGLQNLQMNIETIEMTNCSIGDNSVGEFLASCSKLKCLRFTKINFKSTEVKSTLFQRTYPKLKYFEYKCPGDSEQLIIFLERNPSVKRLRIADEHLLEIPSDATAVQLDYLDIDICEANDTNEVLNQLKMLHANGFFKKLRLMIAYPPDGFDSEMFIREMISFNALEVLETNDFYTNGMDHLTQLKELHMRLLDDDIDLELMAMNLVNLERLRIDGTVNQLLPFLRHSKRLKFIMFDNYTGDYSALNPLKLNRLRQISGMKLKIRIGVCDDQYLATKWNEQIIKCDLVEITREELISKYFYCE